METPTLNCRNDQRRHEVRRPNDFNGLDYLEVSDNQLELKVYFLKKVNAHLAEKLRDKRRIVLKGGRRKEARNLSITKIKLEQFSDPNRDDYLVIELGKPGDFSIYTLFLAALVNGQPSDEPMEGFDPRYAQMQFSFKANCPSDVDCKTPKICPPPTRVQPEINYLAKDYASFRRLMLDRLSQIMPAWKERHVPDLGIALVEILAYAGDYLSYYQDAVATEAYLNTARQRISVRRHARLVDYLMHEGCNARTWVCVKTNREIEFRATDIYFVTPVDFPVEGVPPKGKVLIHDDLDKVPFSAYHVFEPLVEGADARLLPPEYLAEVASLARKLKESPDALSQFLRDNFSDATKSLLEQYDPTLPIFEEFLNDLKTHLTNDLDFRIQNEQNRLYDEQRFAHVPLTEEIRNWAKQDPPPSGNELIRLNRVLLEKAYPQEIAWSQMSFLHFYPAHNEMLFYTWRDHECCLPRGATSATLWNLYIEKKAAESDDQPPTIIWHRNALHLRVGDVLIFEEVIGPKTGNPADADPFHRHAVRLTRVEYTYDPLMITPVTPKGEPVVEIEWAEEDALPFPLCISAVGPAPVCEHLENLSVARGNVVLADHGRRVVPIESLGQVQLKNENLKCVREGRPEDAILEPIPFRAHLQHGPLTFSEPLAPQLPAAKLLKQDLIKALPQIALQCSCLTAGEIIDTEWLPQLDLLRSHPVDRHFVVEMDNDRIAHLRFGDGQSGRQPEVGESFEAFYRVGNGMNGNIGAEALSHLVLRKDLRDDTLELEPRNPLPAKGGVEAEPLAEVKLFAPTAFRKRLERAITPEDYAELAVKRQAPRVQKAAGTLRWNGSWYEVRVAIDPFETPEAEDKLLQEILTDLQRFRRMGHDLEVARAEFVALDIRMEICVRPGHLRGHVKVELLNKFSNKVLPDGSRGFFHPDNLTLGQSIRLSNLYAEAQRIPGVESVNITKFQRLFQEPQNEIDNGLLPINPLEIARLDNDPNFPENGRLEFVMRGGR